MNYRRLPGNYIEPAVFRLFRPAMFVHKDDLDIDPACAATCVGLAGERFPPGIVYRFRIANRATQFKGDFLNRIIVRLSRYLHLFLRVSTRWAFQPI